MLLSASPPVLLTCLTWILCGALHHAAALMYRGCAYRPVAGKEQALWFCLADNLCAMFHCQENSVFSSHDCGCVPAQQHPQHQSTTTTTTTASGVTSTSSGSNGNGSSDSVSAGYSTTPTVLHSGSGSIARTPRPSCQPHIHIENLSATVPGSNNLNDSSNNNTTTTTTTPTTSNQNSIRVEPRGVIDLGNGSALYDGYSYLAIPAYTNTLFDSGLTVDFVVEEGTSVLRQVLMTNCKHGKGASVEIVLDVELGVIVFHVMYRFRKALNAVESNLQVAVPYTAFVPKRVVLVFDGRYLRGRVNDSEKSVRVQGNGDYVLAQRRKPLLFGNTLCDLDDVYGYRGQIRQISIYRCAKSMTHLFS